jgi:hypothetical protein
MRNIVNNPLIRDFGHFVDFSEARTLPGYQDFKVRYVGFLSFAINHAVHGLHVTGYYLFNLSIHLVNALLVYLLVIQAFEAPLMRRGTGPASSVCGNCPSNMIRKEMNSG